MTRGLPLSLSCLAAALCLSCSPVTTADAEPGDADLLDLERMLRQRRYTVFHGQAGQRRACDLPASRAPVIYRLENR